MKFYKNSIFNKITEKEFEARLIEFNGEKIDKLFIKNQKQAEDFLNEIKNSVYKVKDIIKKPLKIDPIISSNQELIEHFRENAGSVYHPCGTCRMGNSKESSVVSHRLKIHGLENLWIVDASIFPNIPSGNINAPVMMSAFMGSQIILDDIKRLNEN